MATGTANIVRLLIRYQNLLWTVRLQMTFSVLPTFHVRQFVLCVCWCVLDPQVHPDAGPTAKHGEPAQAEQRASHAKAAEENHHRQTAGQGPP